MDASKLNSKAVHLTLGRFHIKSSNAFIHCVLNLLTHFGGETTLGERRKDG